MIRAQNFLVAIFCGLSTLLVGNQFPREPLQKASFPDQFIKKLDTPLSQPNALFPLTIGLTVNDEFCNAMAPYLAYSIIQKVDNAVLSQSTLPQALWKEMKLLGSSSVLQKIKRTETHFGTAVLSHLICEPVGISSIAQRQKVLKQLLNSSDCKKIRTSLQKIHAVEANLVRWYTHLDALKTINVHPTQYIDVRPGAASINSTLLPLLYHGFYTAAGFGTGFALRSYAMGHPQPSILAISGVALGYAIFVNIISNHFQTFLRTTQSILISLAQVVDEATQIAQVIRGNHTLVEFPEFQELLTLLDASQQPHHLKALISLLQANTFKGSPSYWSRDSKIMQARIHLIESHNEIRSLLRAIGIVDAYISVASLMRNTQDTDRPYTFVTFVDDEKPFLSLVNAWSPLEDNFHTSITCGRSSPQNTLITGESSKVIPTFGICALLAHTFGIAPAQEALMSHFTLFHTCRTSDHFGLSDRLAKLTLPQQHALVLYQEDTELPFDQFVKIVAPQLARSAQFMIVAATNTTHEAELMKLGFGKEVRSN